MGERVGAGNIPVPDGRKHLVVFIGQEVSFMAFVDIAEMQVQHPAALVEETFVEGREVGIAAGLGEYFEIPREEMYGERFDIPAPDELVLVSWFQGGEVFRSGCCYRRGAGRIFYFRPGHETYPTYHQPEVLRVIANGVRWAALNDRPEVTFGHRPLPLEPVPAQPPEAGH